MAGLSFRVEPGTITGFLGPNGAGKSTTLRSVLGLVHPDQGRAEILGRPYRELDSPLRRVGAVLEASEVHPGRSGRNHLRVQAASAGLPPSRVDEVLSLVELSASARRRVKGYSLGMRQRLGLATALLGDPEVLVLDEPANGLDPAGIRWLRDLLRVARRGGSDDPRLEPRPRRGGADRRPRRDHPPRAADPTGLDRRGAGRRAGRDARALARRRPAAGAARGQGLEVSEADEALLVDAPPERIGELAAANNVVLHELSVERATLEEVFLELTGGETTE